MKKTSEMQPAMKWLIAILLIGAAAMSLWLTVEKLSGRISNLAGCGAGSSCANVLGSKWSVVLGRVPVSVFSSALYLAVLVSLWLRDFKVHRLRMLAAWVFIAAAVWFTALQIFVLKTMCPYCMTMHGVGVLLGVLILLVEFKVKGARKRSLSSMVLAVVMVLGLAVVQSMGPTPDTHRLDVVTGMDLAAEVAKSDIHAAGEGRLVSFFEGKKSYRIDALPHIGSADAEYVIVKYFDYTCEACRDVHGDLETIRTKYPGKLAVIVLPVPLNKNCNPNLPAGVQDHVNACEFAKLSLTVWRADRSKFVEFHTWLFKYHDQPYEAAEAMAYSLVGEGKMEAVDRSWVDAVLLGNVADYKVFAKNTPVMPKVLMKGSKMIQGAAKDVNVLELLLRQNIGLKN